MKKKYTKCKNPMQPESIPNKKNTIGSQSTNKNNNKNGHESVYQNSKI